MESTHGSAVLSRATAKRRPRYWLCPGYLPQYRLHRRGGEMAASGYAEHDDWLFPIFRRAVTDLSLGLHTGARVGTTRWPPEPQNPTPRVASSSQYQRPLRTPVLLCRHCLCALGGCQSVPECGPALGPRVAAGLSEANGRASTLDQYAGGFGRGGFDASSPSPNLESRRDVRAGLRHLARDRDYHRAGVGQHGAPGTATVLLRPGVNAHLLSLVGAPLAATAGAGLVAPLQRWPVAVCTTIFSGASPALYRCRAALPDELLYHCLCRGIRLAALVRDPRSADVSRGGSGPVQWRIDRADWQKTRGCRRASSDALDGPREWPAALSTNPRHNRRWWSIQLCVEKRSHRQEKLILITLEMDRREFTNRVTISETYMGSEADLARAISLEQSPVA